MRPVTRVGSSFLLILLLTLPGTASAQIDARMFRYPAVSRDQIVFVYAGDIWLVPKTGGTATRLSSPPGKEMFPRFSPDGTRIAFSADYDGNLDVYVISTKKIVRGGPWDSSVRSPLDEPGVNIKEGAGRGRGAVSSASAVHRRSSMAAM